MVNDIGQSIFAAKAPEAGAISHLFVITLVVCAVIFTAVTAMVVYSLVKFRWREGEQDPVQLAGSKKVELIWTVIPLLIVVFLFALTVNAMRISSPPKAASPDIVVVGKQWWWEIHYPKTGLITANEIHIPVGKPIAVQVQAADVVHAFWVPELTRQMSNIPGYPNNLWMEADKAGTYMGLCSEFCGTQHAWMRFQVVAEPQAQFDAWQKAQLAPAAAPAGAAARGWDLFRSMSCINCHAITGTDAKAHVGPDLTHFASRKQIGAGVLENSHESILRWMRNPQAVKPGVKMPNFKFSEQQLTDLTQFLETLK